MRYHNKKINQSLAARRVYRCNGMLNPLTTCHTYLLRLILLSLVSILALPGLADFQHYITRDGHRLMDGTKEFRFAGIHAPELHRIEDDNRGVCAADPRGWGQYFKWPTAEEQGNWIKALTRSGHKAMRVYVLSVATPYDKACQRETHILPPSSKHGLPRLNERAMRHYDRMIALASQHQLRLILPFIDHWKWWGGRKQLAAFYNEPEQALHDVTSKTFNAYLDIIRQVITRKNTLTGNYYYEEKAIMAWETGNELKESTEAFVTRTAAHIKSLAKNQLVIDGTYLKINGFSLEDDNIDIISNHFYTTNNNNEPQQVLRDLKAINGKKVYLIGEFGLKDAKGLNAIMQQVVHGEYKGARAAGAFIWGFRGHRGEGGFYWHKEYTGHYSYRLPGFPEGEANQEQQVIDLVRLAQAQMAGLKKAPALPIPEAPILRPINSPQHINWLGAPLGRYYRIQRSKQLSNKQWSPWLTLAEKISDGHLRYNPKTQSLFQDNPLQNGRYRYRIFASNESGESPASNIEYLQLP